MFSGSTAFELAQLCESGDQFFLIVWLDSRPFISTKIDGTTDRQTNLWSSVEAFGFVLAPLLKTYATSPCAI
jgi:hypothetical protein